jgi:hypothetical protein
MEITIEQLNNIPGRPSFLQPWREVFGVQQCLYVSSVVPAIYIQDNGIRWSIDRIEEPPDLVAFSCYLLAVKQSIDRAKAP